METTKWLLWTVSIKISMCFRTARLIYTLLNITYTSLLQSSHWLRRTWWQVDKLISPTLFTNVNLYIFLWIGSRFIKKIPTFWVPFPTRIRNGISARALVETTPVFRWEMTEWNPLYTGWLLPQYGRHCIHTGICSLWLSCDSWFRWIGPSTRQTSEMVDKIVCKRIFVNEKSELSLIDFTRQYLLSGNSVRSLV